MKKFFKSSLSKGFTLMELLVVGALIAILAAIVIISLNNTRIKAANSGVHQNLSSARAQAEIFYNTNTAAPATYTSVCSLGPVGGAETLSKLIIAASKSAGLGGAYSIDAEGHFGQATCNQTPSAWAVEVPLLGGGGNFWCADSTGASRIVASVSLGDTDEHSCD